ncbi:hypothetical protein TELCIR_14615, partial [Teladorsagia circumcincta]
MLANCDIRVIFCFAGDNVDDVKLLVSEKFNYNMTYECVNGHVNVFDWKVLSMIIYMTLPVTPVYTAILILRKLTIAKLSAERLMSENSKHLHGQLLKINADSSSRTMVQKMDWMLLLSILVHTVTNVSGLITNGLLIYLVL